MVNIDNVSFIEDSKGKKAVILSLNTYKKMQEKIEELEDIENYIKVIKDQDDEVLPYELVEALIIGEESKIKIMRKYRRMTINELAKKVDITESYLSQIESGKRNGTIEIYKKLSKALEIDIDNII